MPLCIATEKHVCVQVVTCSGIGADGSLRIVTNGIGMVGQATVELGGIRGLWGLRPSSADSYDSFMVPVCPIKIRDGTWLVAALGEQEGRGRG